MQYPYPSSPYGYFRGAPLYGGYGSGNGPNVSGISQFAQGQGGVGTQSSWNPTILYLFVLIVAEMFVFGLLSRHV